MLLKVKTRNIMSSTYVKSAIDAKNIAHDSVRFLKNATETKNIEQDSVALFKKRY